MKFKNRLNLSTDSAYKEFMSHVKEKKIIPAVFPPGVHTREPQDKCYIILKDPVIHKKYKNCPIHSVGLATFSRKATELGMQGWMSNQKNGLKPVAYNPKAGVDHRTPQTMIVIKGKVVVTHDPVAGSKGIFELDENDAIE